MTVRSSAYPLATAGGEAEDLVTAGHACVAGGRHDQRTVGGTVLDGGLQVTGFHQPVDPAFHVIRRV